MRQKVERMVVVAIVLTLLFAFVYAGITGYVESTTRQHEEKAYEVRENIIHTPRVRSLADQLSTFEGQQLKDPEDVFAWKDAYISFYEATGVVFDREGLRERADKEYNRRVHLVKKLTDEEYFAKEKAKQLQNGQSFVINNNAPLCGAKSSWLEAFVSFPTLLEYLNKGWISRSTFLRCVRESDTTHAVIQTVVGHEDSWVGVVARCMGATYLPSVLDNLRGLNGDTYSGAVDEIAAQARLGHLTRDELVSVGLTPKEADIIINEANKQEGVSK